jgi:hypothetical protein
MSIPQARDAILRSLRDNRAAATAGFRLSQDAEDARDTGVVIYTRSSRVVRLARWRRCKAWSS